jgi:hypothetical protein
MEPRFAKRVLQEAAGWHGMEVVAKVDPEIYKNPHSHPHQAEHVKQQRFFIRNPQAGWPIRRAPGGVGLMGWDLLGGDDTISYMAEDPLIPGLHSAYQAWSPSGLNSNAGSDMTARLAALPQGIAGITHSTGLMEIASWLPGSAYERALLEHEAGHSGGLGHGGDGIMRTPGAPEYTISSSDMDSMRSSIERYSGNTNGQWRGGVVFMQPGGTWYPHVAAVNSEVESQWPTSGSTYPGHGADGDPMNSVDWVMPTGWGVDATGNAQVVGDEIVSFLESEQQSITDYIIWDYMANYGGGWERYTGGGGYPAPSDPSGYHTDHVHWEALMQGESGDYSGGGGSFGFDPMGLIMPLINKIPKPNLGSGTFFKDLAGSLFSWAVDSVTSWAQAQADKLGFLSPGGSSAPPASGDLQDWAKSGLEYGAAFDASSGNISKIVSLAQKESGGDPNAQNPDSSAAGLMQLIESTWNAYKVAASDDIFNPVQNVAASSRYQKDRYGELVTHSPYTRGGIAMLPQYATVAEHGPEFFMPLHDPESARRFLGFMENAAIERMEHGALPWQRRAEALPNWGRLSGGGGGAFEAVVAEVRALRRSVESGIPLAPESADRVGDAAAGGTMHRLPNSPEGRDAVRRASNKEGRMRVMTGGRISD